MPPASPATMPRTAEAVEAACDELKIIGAALMKMMERGAVIPFGSQRARGQDLATHLLNAQDNERLEVAQVRGSVARDLHGAFAEWEAQAHNLTRCTNYLYSLSINPGPAAGPARRKEQYLDYIERAEQRLGLVGPAPRGRVPRQEGQAGRPARALPCHLVAHRRGARATPVTSPTTMTSS